MKRRKFLKIIGVGTAVPTIIEKAFTEKPRYLITSSDGGPPRIIKFSPIGPDPLASFNEYDAMFYRKLSSHGISGDEPMSDFDELNEGKIKF